MFRGGLGMGLTEQAGALAVGGVILHEHATLRDFRVSAPVCGRGARGCP